MRVLVIGGYGLIGAGIVAHLRAGGHAVSGAGRNVTAAARRQPGMAWHRIDMASATPAEWAVALAGCEAVVNCAGALQDSPADNLAALQVEGLRRLLDACRAAGIHRFIQVSAAGVAASPGAFGATRREAEALLAGSGLDWIILRPGLVLAPVAFGGSALLRALAACPLVIPAIHADRVVQVVGLDAVAEAVALALLPDAPSRCAIDLVAEEATTLEQILRALRGWLGLAPAPVVTMPGWIVRVGASLADAAAWLGWRSPMRGAAVAQLAAGVRGDAGAARLPGLRISGLAEWLARHPAGVQEAWFARLYLLKPVILGTLAAFWLASGLVGVAQLDRAAAVLAPAGFPPALARASVWLGSAADIAVGLLACHRRTARLGLLGMVAITGAYLAGATLWRPDLWADPLGPLVKVLPAALLAVVALAMLEER